MTMRSIIATGLVLVFAVSSQGGPVLAQAETAPDPSPSASPSGSPDVIPALEADQLAFAEPEWHMLRTARAPAPREDHTWTVDGEGRFAYLFGGRDGTRDFGDLWRYDLANDTWKKLSPQGKRPEPRFGHSAVWVEGYGVIVFAGQRGSDFFGDLWVFDPERGRWRSMPANGGAPKPRYGSCMVVGPDGRLWVSHGFTFAGRFDDTRAYNLKSRRWASIGPAGRRPGERCLHDCFTSATGELVLYGGQDNGAFALGDLWLMGTEHVWERQSDPPLRARRLYAVAEAGADAWIFGGADEGNAALDDLWRVDRESLGFQRVRIGGASPPARYAGTLITDAKRGRLLLFGGQGKSAKDDLWELVDGAAPPEDANLTTSEVVEPSSSPSPVS